MWGGPKLTSVVFAAGASVLMTSGVAFAEYSPISENGIRISEDIKSEIKSPKDIDVVLYQYQVSDCQIRSRSLKSRRRALRILNGFVDGIGYVISPVLFATKCELFWT